MASLHPEIGKREMRLTRELRSGLSRWEDVEHINEIFLKQPSAPDVFDKVVSSSEMRAALKRIAQEEPRDLAFHLERGLSDSFGDLKERCPKTIADLDAREKATEELFGTAGSTRDYFMQRLTSISGILDLRKRAPLSANLEKMLADEADKLATMLIAFEKAEGIEHGEEFEYAAK